VIEVVGGLEEAGQVVSAPPPAQLEDLALYIGRDPTPNPAARTGRRGAAGLRSRPTLGLALAGDPVPSLAPWSPPPRLIRAALPLGGTGRSPRTEATFPPVPGRSTPMLATVVVVFGAHRRRVSMP
jgi:hypothetical protein